VYSSITHAAVWLKYALIAYLFLNLFLRFLLPLFIPFSTSIGHLSPASLHNLSIKWKGLHLTVGKFGVSARGGGKTAWWVLYGEGIKLKVPRSALLDLVTKPNQAKTSKTKETKESEPCSTPPCPPPQPSRLRRILLPFLVRRLFHIVSIHLEVTLDVEDVGLIEGTLKFGGRYKKPHLRVPIVGTPRQEDKVSVWASVEDLTLTEPLRGLDQKEHKKLLPAVELREKVTFRLSGPVGYEEWKTLRPREGSIRASMEREEEKDGILARMKRGHHRDEKSSEGLVVRIHQLKRLLRSVEEVHSEVKDKKEQLKSQTSSTSSSPSSSKDSPSCAKPSPLAYFDSFSISLPTVIFALHYTTPISVMASSSPSVNQSLPQTIGFAAIISGIKGNLKLKAKSEGEWIRDSHKAYLGRGRVCEVIGSIGWEELEGRMDANAKEGSFSYFCILPRSNGSVLTQRMNCREYCEPNRQNSIDWSIRDCSHLDMASILSSSQDSRMRTNDLEIHQETSRGSAKPDKLQRANRDSRNVIRRSQRPSHLRNARCCRSHLQCSTSNSLSLYAKQSSISDLFHEGRRRLVENSLSRSSSFRIDLHRSLPRSPTRWTSRFFSYRSTSSRTSTFLLLSKRKTFSSSLRRSPSFRTTPSPSSTGQSG
jgi:hypothetical protein